MKHYVSMGLIAFFGAAAGAAIGAIAGNLVLGLAIDRKSVV